MALTFEEDPETPGLIYAVDSETGLRRPAYDRSGALRASLEARVGAPEPPPVYTPEPEAPVSVQDALRAPPMGPPPPPAEPDPVAAAWQRAQEPAPAPVVRASGAPMPPPAAPAGTTLTKAKVEMGTPGYTYDNAAEEQRGADLLERTSEIDRRAALVDAVMNEQQIELGKQREDAARREAINAERSTRYERELRETVQREINPDRIRQNTSLFGSILGIIGQGLAEVTQPGAWEQIQRALDARVERDIQAQREQRDSMISMLTRKLGSAQQAEAHYRAQTNALAADLIETRLKRLGLAEAYGDQIQGLRDQAMAYNEAAKVASFGKPGKAEYEFERLKGGAGGPVYTNETLSKLKAIGIDEKRYREGLDAKTSGGLTVRQTGDAIKQLDADTNAIRSLMAANGGDLAGREVIQLPQSLSNWAAQLGIESHMNREEVNQLIQQHVIARAKQLGGETTAADLAAAQKEIGVTPTAYLRWLQRARDVQNREIRSALEQQFPGRGQQVFELLLGGASKNVGVPQTKATPFETRNAPPASEPARERSDVEKRQAENRRKLRERVGGFFDGFGSPIQLPQSGRGRF